MYKHELMHLTNEQLYSYFCTIGEQYINPFVIIDLYNESLPIQYYNQPFANLTGYDLEELIGKNFSYLQGTQTSLEAQQELNFHIVNELVFETRLLLYKKDGTAFWIQLCSHPIKNYKGETAFVLVQCRDITEEMLERMLHKIEHEVYVKLEQDSSLEDILQLITEHIERNYIRKIYCAIHILQKNAVLKAIASPTLPLDLIEPIVGMEVCPTTGFSEKAVYIKDLSYLKDLGTQSETFKIQQLASEYHIQYCWSKPIFNKEKSIMGTFTIYIENNSYLKQSDIDFLNKLSPIIALTIKYFEQKKQLKQLAFYDMNIGIPNSNYFKTRLQEWIQNGVEGTIMLIQPGEYISIVDMYGRKVGDSLIKQIVERIEKIVNEDLAIYGRFSNSSFILGKNIPIQNIDCFINKIVNLTTQPYLINGRAMFITLKIGVSYFNPRTSIDESIRQADIALTKSRLKLGTVVSFFEEETDEQIQRELNVLNQLTHGLKNNEFTVYLQPKVDLKTAEIVGFEALARWFSPVLGNVSPAEFIPIAEQAGKVREIDNIVLEMVLNWQQERKKKGLPLYPVSVNISPIHFYHDSFVEDFLSLVNKYQIEPDYIKIEVTESFELFDFEKAKEILTKLKEHGYESSIDDFGVGFSSLSYLQRLPFSEFKIDRSFINDIHDNGMHAVVKTIVQLANSLDMHSVAEGIETLNQYQKLLDIGCHTGQGYYFHKPMPIEEAEKLINTIK
ncbi:MAG: EAL domain-containing protein [Lysinibacillus sp.]|nr:EAL domain-containing protein [Lysinibacillus sp.]